MFLNYVKIFIVYNASEYNPSDYAEMIQRTSQGNKDKSKNQLGLS